MKGKELSELTSVSIDENTLLLVQNAGDGAGKTTLKNAREAIGVSIDTVTASTTELEVGASATAEAVVTGTDQNKDIAFNFGLPKVKSVKTFKQTTESAENSGVNVYTATMSDGDTETFTCKNGKGINSIEQTQSSTTSGEVNSYTITLSDNTTFTINVYNGRAGKDFAIVKTYTSISAMEEDFSGTDVSTYDFVLIDTGSVEDEDTGKLYYKGAAAWVYIGDLSGKQGIKGETGVSIQSIALKSSESGSKGANIYTITMSDGTTSDFTVYNGDDGTPADFGNVTADITMIATTDSASVEATTDKDTPITARDMNFSFKIPKPNGIASIVQTTESDENNGTNIWTATLDNGDTSEFKVKNGKVVLSDSDIENILSLCHPVGSLYWSAVNTDPSTLFGGTWEQIKDKFILAAGDSYDADATGGSATVTLTVANLPSHLHSFTPSGTVTVGSHTHSFTPSGTISVKTNPTFTGSAVTSGNESAHEKYSWTGSHTHTDSGHTHSFNMTLYSRSRGGTSGVANIVPSESDTEVTIESSKANIQSTSITVSGTCTGDHTHSVTAAGTISGGAYTFTGTAGTSGGTTPTGSFTGTAGNTGNTGSGTAVNILPPYIVKYCWQRTA